MTRKASSSSSYSAPPAPTPSDVDTALWRASAGASLVIPSVGSRVYYFPQGHFEQCLSFSSPPPTIITPSSFAPSSSPPPAFFHCRVLSIRFLAHPLTDEPFASIHLLPILLPTPHSAGIICAATPSENDDVNAFGGIVDNLEDGGGNDVVSFAKILTPSDANNGGGFSVPRFCADSIFPPLDFEAEPPVQNLMIRDLHGNSWQFRHIYRGTPRRHLLTTGWSKFVNSKKLVAGDSVVFMRRETTGELYAAVRRALRGNDVSERWNCPANLVKAEENYDNYWRNETGTVGMEAVFEAMENAARGRAFEVVCFPRPGWSEFVVKAESVEEAMGVFWSNGVRVKMAIEAEDSTRTTWCQGTISSATKPESGPWCGSPWRMLQVTWDEPEILQHVKRVSPWQVEYVAASLHASFPPTKKLKALHNSEFLPNGEEEPAFPMAGLTSSLSEPLNPSSCDYTIPASMQGARQKQKFEFIVSDLEQNQIRKVCSDKFMDDGLQLKVEALPTQLTIGGSWPSENSSLDSSISFRGTGLVEKQDSNSSPQAGPNSFQLFGKIIHMAKPVEVVNDDTGFQKERDVEYKQIEGSGNPVDPSLIYSYAKLINSVHVQ